MINKKLLKGSLILLITINLFNLLNFIYNVSMARLLSLTAYGTLTVLINIVILLAVFTESIQTVITKYTAREKNLGKIKNLIRKSFSKCLNLSLVLYLSYLILALPVADFLQIPYYLLAITGLMIFPSFFLPITRGVLQGRKKFTSLGMNFVVEGAIKLAIAITLVLLGMSIFGAVLGMILGGVAALLVSFANLPSILKSKEVKSSNPGIYDYTKPVFITTLSIVLFLSLDVILAKRFFPGEMVGAYAIASTIAKIVFIGTQPISKAMFPLSASSKKESKPIMTNSLALISILIVAFLALIYLFPEAIVSLFSGKTIPSASGILIYLSIAMSFLSLANLILLHHLSINKEGNFNYLLFFVAFQAIVLTMFHDNLIEFSMALIVAAATFLWGSIFLFRQ